MSGKIIRAVAITVLAVLSIALPVRARELLADPEPIAIPAEGITQDEVLGSIKAALMGRTWTIEKVAPGRVDAALYIRRHVARIAITFDEASIRIAYQSSDNLDFKEKRGQRYIHENYLGWIQNLAGDIRRHVSNAAFAD